MQCDVCGREIIGRHHKVIIEGAKVIACTECAKLGSGYWTQERDTRSRKVTLSIPKSTRLTRDSRTLIQEVSRDELEVVEGFGSIIKRAREKLGLTPEDLGKMIGEKESVIKKIECEKIVPDIRLASKLEHALKIKLLVKQPKTSLDTSAVASAKGKRSVTFGEVARIRGADGEG